MSLRAKVFFGVVLFIVIFGFRFMCVSCQQVVADIVVEDHIQPQAWHQPEPTELALNSEITVDNSYQNPTQTWPANQNGRRRRRPGGRKRRRRPQANNQTAELSEINNNYYWEGQVHDEALNDSVLLSFDNSSDYYSSTEPASGESQETIKRNFVQNKQRTERVREPLAALEQEQRLSEIRNKQKWTMNTDVTTASAALYHDKSYRKPYSQQTKRQDFISQPPPKSAIELKDILKNSGDLSLSEILQQNNLSLDDLIKGKQNALQALQTPNTPTTDQSVRFIKPIRRIPIIYLATSTTTSTESTSTNSYSEKPNEESTTEKISITPAEVDHRMTSENVIQDNDFATSISLKYFSMSSQLPTENSVDIQKSASTEVYPKTQQKSEILDEEPPERLSSFYALPTRPSYRKRLTIKPALRFSATNKTPKDSSSSSESTSDEKHSGKSYHEKSSSSSQESIEERLLHKEPETNLIEKFATFEEAKPKDVATIEELFRPLYQKKDNSNLFEAITSRVDIFAEKHFGFGHTDATESNPVSFTDVDTTQDVDDRTDLLELLEDRRSGNRLIKVLAQRNMSLNELIEHRQRGSSQLHLSEIVQNKTGTPTKAFSIKPQVLDEKLDIVTAFGNFPHFNVGNLKSVNPDEIKTDSEGSSYFTSIIDIKPTDDLLKKGREMKSLTFESVDPTTFVASGEDKSIDFYAQPWKSFAVPISYTSQEAINYIDQPGEASAQVSQQEEADTDTDAADKLDPVAQIEDEVARAHDILDLELTGHGLRRAPIMQPGEIPLGVKSAVTASSLIVLFSLTIFLMIFIVCRWKQRRRKKLTYMDNYNAMKKTHLPIISTQSTMKRIEPPMLAAATAASGNPMIFPGAKNNKINTMDPNSPEVQEYLFDAIRKPF